MNAHLIQYPQLFIRDVPGKGRGVFAGKNFSEGEIIERAPVIIFSKVDWECNKGLILSNYLFYWPPNDEYFAIALGFGSLYNHACPANLSWIRNVDEQIIEFIAYRTIKIDEELFINYNGFPNDSSPTWFDIL